MKNKTGLMVVLMATAMTNASAFDWFGGRLSIGGGYGYSKPKLPYSFQNTYDAGPMWTTHLQYYLNNDLALVASYADLRARSRTTPDDIHFRPLVGSVRYNIFHHLPITPYVTAGAGVGFNKMELPNGATARWNKLTAQGGLGFEFFLNENTSIGAEALYHHFEAPSGVRPYRPISAVGMMNLYFGDGPNTRRVKDEAARSKSQAEEAQRQTAAAQQQASSAQEQALNSQQAQAASQQQLTAAQQATATAEAARLAAERRAQEMQAQVEQAQAEMNAIKDMVARKDIQPVTFESGKAILLPSSNATLNKVAEIAKKYPNLKLRVEGHTDSQGSDSLNQELSQKRAEAVRAYLAGPGGVANSPVDAVGLGESHPIASNETSDGRAKNRRVEFIFSI